MKYLIVVFLMYIQSYTNAQIVTDSLYYEKYNMELYEELHTNIEVEYEYMVDFINENCKNIIISEDNRYLTFYSLKNGTSKSIKKDNVKIIRIYYYSYMKEFEIHLSNSKKFTIQVEEEIIL